MRCKQQRAFGHGFQQAGHALSQQRALSEIAVARADVGITRIDQADVCVQSAAGKPGEGFGHKSRVKAMLTGDSANQSPQQHKLVAGQQWIINMAQIDLELAGCVLRNCGIGGQALGRGGGRDSVEDRREIVDFPDAVDLSFALRAACDRIANKRRPAVFVEFRVDQVKLGFERYHRA